MAYQGIGTGTAPNDNTGDSLLTGAIKINSNFKEIYNALGDGTDITINSIVPVASTTIDCSKGNYFTKTVSSNTTFSFSNIPSGEIYSLTIKIVHTAGSILWPASVKWSNDEEPIAESGGTHLFMFMTDNSGSTWRGAALLNYPS